MTLNILHLYPKEFNLYSDIGNLIALKKRCEWRDIKVKIIEHNIGDKLPEDVDFIFMGGGSVNAQGKVLEDAKANREQLKTWIEDNIPTLLISEAMQLFGKTFPWHDGTSYEGLNILKLDSRRSEERLVGDVVVETPEFGKLVGYENHAYTIELDDAVASIGKTSYGHGNNDLDQTEGHIYNNCIASNLHGPLLPRNTLLCDWLIRKALENKTGKFQKLAELDDEAEQTAHDNAILEIESRKK